MNHNDRAASPNRRDGGYALVFVLVVMVVLCLVASSLLSVSLRNLKNQQTAIEQIQDEYTAQGAIEQVVSQLCATETFTGASLDAAINAKITELCNAVYGGEENLGTVSPSAEPADGQPAAQDEEPGPISISVQYPFTLTSVYGCCTIECKLELTGTVTSDAASGWKASELHVTYLSYEVGQTAESEEEGSE